MVSSDDAKEEAVEMIPTADIGRSINSSSPAPPLTDSIRPPSSNGFATGTNELWVCLSGGGIRSAYFQLGALEELVSTMDTKHWPEGVGAITKVSSVSGGGYISAGILSQWDKRRKEELSKQQSNISTKLGVGPLKETATDAKSNTESDSLKDGVASELFTNPQNNRAAFKKAVQYLAEDVESTIRANGSHPNYLTASGIRDVFFTAIIGMMMAASYFLPFACFLEEFYYHICGISAAHEDYQNMSPFEVLPSSDALIQAELPTEVVILIVCIFGLFGVEFTYFIVRGLFTFFISNNENPDDTGIFVSFINGFNKCRRSCFHKKSKYSSILYTSYILVKAFSAAGIYLFVIIPMSLWFVENIFHDSSSLVIGTAVGLPLTIFNIIAFAITNIQESFAMVKSLALQALPISLFLFYHGVMVASIWGFLFNAESDFLRFFLYVAPISWLILNPVFSVQLHEYYRKKLKHLFFAKGSETMLRVSCCGRAEDVEDSAADRHTRYLHDPRIFKFSTFVKGMTFYFNTVLQNSNQVVAFCAGHEAEAQNHPHDKVILLKESELKKLLDYPTTAPPKNSAPDIDSSKDDSNEHLLPPISLSSAMATSAAAISISNGDVSALDSIPARLTFFLLPLQLGRWFRLRGFDWWPKPLLIAAANLLLIGVYICGVIALSDSHSHGPFIVLTCLYFFLCLGGAALQQVSPVFSYLIPVRAFTPVFGSLIPLADSTKLPYMYLSDGGHVENLGLITLLKELKARVDSVAASGSSSGIPNKSLPIIVAFDAGADPELELADLYKALKMAQKEEYISDYRVDPGDARSIWQAAVSILIHKHAESRGIAGFAGGVGAEHVQENVQRVVEVNLKMHTGCDVRLLYVKLMLTGKESDGLIYLRALSSTEFPHHSTANQALTDFDFIAYKKLGAESARDAIKAIKMELKPATATHPNPPILNSANTNTSMSPTTSVDSLSSPTLNCSSISRNGTPPTTVTDRSAGTAAASADIVNWYNQDSHDTLQSHRLTPPRHSSQFTVTV